MIFFYTFSSCFLLRLLLRVFLRLFFDVFRNCFTLLLSLFLNLLLWRWPRTRPFLRTNQIQNSRFEFRSLPCGACYENHVLTRAFDRNNILICVELLRNQIRRLFRVFLPVSQNIICTVSPGINLLFSVFLPYTVSKLWPRRQIINVC